MKGDQRKQTNSPSHHDGAKPFGGTRPLHHDVGWHFRRDVEGEEHREGNVVIQARHPKVLLKTRKTSISNVGTIKERKPILTVRKKLATTARSTYRYSKAKNGTRCQSILRKSRLVCAASNLPPSPDSRDPGPDMCLTTCFSVEKSTDEELYPGMADISCYASLIWAV
jgi:hypothetical protein